MEKTLEEYAQDALEKLVKWVLEHQGNGVACPSEEQDGMDKQNATVMRFPTLTYKKLAEEIKLEGEHQGDGFATKMAKILEKVGDMLGKVASVLGIKIPQLMALVVRGDTNLPGKGIEKFIPGYEAANKNWRKQRIEQEHKDIANFKDWKKVLEEANKLW